MNLNNAKAQIDTMLLAHIADSLTFIAWSKTKDGSNGRNRPKSILELIMNSGLEKEDEVIAFETSADYEKSREELLRGISDGD